MVKEVWTEVHEGQTPLDHWQAKIRRLRQYLGVGPKIFAVLTRKRKKHLLDKLDVLSYHSSMMTS
jgi:hypothetical protein